MTETEFQKWYEDGKRELKNNLTARMSSNGGTLNLLDIFKEATYFLAVNTILIQRNLANEEQLPIIPSTTKSIMFEHCNRILEETFPHDYKKRALGHNKEELANLLADPLVEDKINFHYDQLYGVQGGSVL
jgi:hypothetical protein